MANLSQPAPSSRAPMVPIFCPPVSPFSRDFLIGSAEPLYTLQHFFERGYLCSGRKSCPLCRAGCGRKAYWWVAAWDKDGKILLRLPHVGEWHDVLTSGNRVRLVRTRKRGELTIQPSLFSEGDDASGASASAVPTEKLFQLVARLFRLPLNEGFDLTDPIAQDAVATAIDDSCLLVAQRFASSRR